MTLHGLAVVHIQEFWIIGTIKEFSKNTVEI